MKKIYVILFCAFSVFINAQTLTQAFNEPKAGDNNPGIAVDTSGFTTGMPIAQTGANQSWDYSKLKTASDPDTIKYVTPSSVSGSSLYPGSTVVRQEPAWDMFLKSVTSPTTQTEVLGLQNAFFAATFTNSVRAAIFPISFGSTNSDNCAGSLKTATMNLALSGKLSYTADGTGTLTLGDGFKYNNVLRMKSVLTFTFSQFSIPFGNFKQTTYEFYDSSEKFPILSINYTAISLAFGSPTVTAFVSGNSKSFTGIADNELSALVSLYPNPANGVVTLFSGEADLHINDVKIFNSIGEHIKTYTYLPSAPVQINTAELASGMYFVVFQRGNQVASKKLIVH